MPTLIDPEDLLVQYEVVHRDPRAFEGIFKTPSSVKKIYIPPGDYELTRMLVVTEPVIIEGEGAGISNLSYNGIGPAIILFFMEGTPTGSGIQNLTIKSTSPQDTTSGIRIDSAELFFIRNTEFINFSGTSSYGVRAQNGNKNLLIDNVNFIGNTSGLILDGVDGASISNISLESSETNVLIQSSNNITWSGGTSKGSPSLNGILIEDGYSISIEGVRSNLGSDVFGVEAGGIGSESVIVNNCSFENSLSTKKGVKFDSVTGGSIIRNRFHLFTTGDTGIELGSSAEINIDIQGAVYPSSSLVNNLDNSGIIESYGNITGTNNIVEDKVVLNVKDFGAVGDGITDDSSAIQNTINSILTSGQRAPIYFPPGTYILDSTIDLPVSIQGLELFGAGWTETDTTTTTLRNNSTGPMFQTTGTGTCGFFKFHDFRMLQGASSGYYFQFDNLTVHMDISRIHCNMSNTAAGCIWMNGVENHMNHVHDMKVVTSGATVPMFWWDGPADSNMTTTTFERITCNTPGATTAPQYLIDNKWTTASPGFKWSCINMEQPNGGGVHLYGIAGAVMENVITSDTASQTAPVYLFDKSHTSQTGLEVTLIQCNSFIGTQSEPDLVIQNTAGGVYPGPINIVGGRYGWFDPGSFGQIHMVGGVVAGYVSGTRPPMRIYSGALMGVKGIGRTHSAVPVNLTRHFAGTATFGASDTKTVTFTSGDLGGADPEADTNYEIMITSSANETIWIDDASKTTTAFTLKSSNPVSTAKVVWMMIRP